MLAPWIAAAVIGGAAVVVGAQLRRHRRRRDRIYAELAAVRPEIVAEYPVAIRCDVEPATLGPQFHRDRFARVDGFLTDDCLQCLRDEAEANLAHVERSYIPTHKQGG